MNELVEFQRRAALLKAVADKDRLRIIVALFSGPKHVGDIAALMSVDIARVSHHLGVLRHAGITVATKHGRYIEYALHSDVYLPGADTTAERSLKLDGYCLAFPAANGSPSSAPEKSP